MSRNLYLFSLFVFVSTYSCNNNNQQYAKQPDYNSKAFQDKLVNANKLYVQQESDEINQYVARKGWKMKVTGTGLRYMILKQDTGILAEFNKHAKVNYKVSLLDGTVCYTSDSTGAKQFRIGQDNVESGLHEAITFMHVGDKALFILPSHLAYGLIGDEHKIPPHASLVYELELLSLN